MPFFVGHSRTLLFKELLRAKRDQDSFRSLYNWFPSNMNFLLDEVIPQKSMIGVKTYQGIDLKLSTILCVCALIRDFIFNAKIGFA